MLKILRLVCHQRQFPAVNVIRHCSYKSDISTEVLYPESKQKLFTPPPPPPVWFEKHRQDLNENYLFFLNLFANSSEMITNSMDIFR